jgi:hypothetical protein
MGRPNLSDQEKAARKTLRPGRVNKNAPVVEALDAIPGPPPGYPEFEAQTWLRLAARLGPSRVVALSDMMAFEVLVMTVALAEKVAADPKASPGQRVRTNSAALAALASVGATPHSRGRVTKAPVVEENSPFAEFL